jgi:hypothetical protein
LSLSSLAQHVPGATTASAAKLAGLYPGVHADRERMCAF